MPPIQAPPDDGCQNFRRWRIVVYSGVYIAIRYLPLGRQVPVSGSYEANRGGSRGGWDWTCPAQPPDRRAGTTSDAHSGVRP